MSKQSPARVRRHLRVGVVIVVMTTLAVVDGAAVAVPSQADVEQQDGSADERSSAAPLASEEAPNFAQNDGHGDFSDEPPTASGLADASRSVAVVGEGSRHVGPAKSASAPVAVPRKGCAAPLTAAVPEGDRQVVDDAAPVSCAKRDVGFVKGESQIIGELTTPTEKVFANPDGSRTSTLSTAPVRFRDTKGQWHEIDLDLEASGRVLRAKSAQFPLTGPTIR